MTFQGIWSFSGSGSRCINSDPGTLFPDPFRYTVISRIKCIFQARCNTCLEIRLISKNEYAIKFLDMYRGFSPVRHWQGTCSRVSVPYRIQPLVKQSMTDSSAMEIWISLSSDSSADVLHNNFRKLPFLYCSMKLSVTLVDCKTLVCVNTLYPVPDNGKLQFQVMFLYI